MIEDIAMAQPDEVLGRRPCAGHVVDLDRPVVGQGRRVDQDDRHTGALMASTSG